MKRLYSLSLLLTMSALFTVGFLPAWDREPWGPGQERNPPGRSRMPNSWHGAPEPLEKGTISGTLSLIKGRIGIQKEGEIYIVVGLGRLIGFVDGLKEGAVVTLEGFVRTDRENSKVHYLQVDKLTIDGKEYDGLAQDFYRKELHRF
ncbi:MAG: hypothetical protein LBD78_00620 [Spirochaetaceae bacterium]|jgi:hypothetical protein|nr:hypothetical protein [Spirochaetaceae bacterium]